MEIKDLFHQVTQLLGEATQAVDLKIILFSYMIAGFATYIALDTASSMRKKTTGRSNPAIWLIGGAIAMGTGLWAIQLIGMEVFIPSASKHYHLFFVLVSLLAATIASGIALFWVARSKPGIASILKGGAAIGLAIAFMHYIGIAALFEVSVHYVPSLLFLSIMGSVVVSQMALWLIIRSHASSFKKSINFLSALAIIATIYGTYHLGMAATILTIDEAAVPAGFQHPLVVTGLPSLYLIIAISFLMALLIRFFSYRKRLLVHLQKTNQSLKAREKKQEQLYHRLLNSLKELEMARNHAEQANIAKSAFLANISHEVRTPLNVIIGTAALLDELDIGEKGKRYANRIVLAGKLLLDIINDVLDFSKLEAGELELKLLSCNFQRILKEVAEIMTVRADEKNLELIVDYSCYHLSHNVISDPIRIKQMMTNLIGNAIKFTEKGHILVKAYSNQLNETQVDIRLEIQDTGVGISPDKYERIFKRFSQADFSTTRKFGGSGLGLAICKQLVDLLGGKIGFESKEHAGSTFWFEIPCQIDKQESGKNINSFLPLNMDIKNLRLLIVDDYEINLRIFEGYLNKLEVRSCLCPSPSKALHLVEEELKKQVKFDLILLDYHMPEMGGIELAKKIKTINDYRHVPLILLSSSRLCSYNADEQLFAAYLVKPIYPAELYQTIYAVLNKTAEAGERIK